MPRETFQDDIDDLREAVFALGVRVADRVRTALDALDTDDAARAQALVDSDADVNERCRALETNCIDLFALQQPVATDLRVVAASYKILTDVERVGDLAAKLAKYARKGSTHAVPTEVDLYQLGVRAAGQFERAMTAYRDGTTEECYAVAEADDELDADCDRTARLVIRDMFYEVPTTEFTPGHVETLLDDTSRLLLALREIERVGDHGVNVAARTLYLVDADDGLLY
jgi:phosphate transport system protein